MSIFRPFRRFVEALEGIRGELAFLGSELTALRVIYRDASPATERLEALELSRGLFEADISGLVLKAEGQLRAALNSEARERQLKKSNDKLADPFTEEGDREETPEGVTVLSNDVAASEAERLQAMRLVVETSPKAAAVNRKWGVA